MALPSWLLVPVGGRRSQRPGSSSTLGSLGPSHHRRHKSRLSLRGPPCAHGVSGIPFGEVRDTYGVFSSMCCLKRNPYLQLLLLVHCWHRQLHVCNCFLITILNNLFWCESTGSKKSPMLVAKIVGIATVISLETRSILTWFIHRMIWACTKPRDCNSYRMTYWSIIPKNLGPYNKTSCMKFSTHA
jgi:hypothetical protein